MLSTWGRRVTPEPAASRVAASKMVCQGVGRNLYLYFDFYFLLFNFCLFGCVFHNACHLSIQKHVRRMHAQYMSFRGYVLKSLQMGCITKKRLMYFAVNELWFVKGGASLGSRGGCGGGCAGAGDGWRGRGVGRRQDPGSSFLLLWSLCVIQVHVDTGAWGW